jgi:hypothetical protein
MNNCIVVSWFLSEFSRVICCDYIIKFSIYLRFKFSLSFRATFFFTNPDDHPKLLRISEVNQPVYLVVRRTSGTHDQIFFFILYSYLDSYGFVYVRRPL